MLTEPSPHLTVARPDPRLLQDGPGGPKKPGPVLVCTGTNSRFCQTWSQKRDSNAMLCVLCSAGQPYCSAKFLSLRTGDEVHNIPYTEPITDIRANDRYANTAFMLSLVHGQSRQFENDNSCYQKVTEICV